MRRHTAAAGIVAVELVAAMTMGSVSAQTGAPAGNGTTFEVASVKPHDPADSRSLMIAEPNGRFTARNIPLRMLIRTAYSVQDEQVVGGPEWLDQATFDIVATSAGGVPLTALAAELQSLLADRFKLRIHRDTRELPVYLFVPARNDGSLGPQLKRHVCDQQVTTRAVDGNQLPWSPCANISNGQGRLTVKGATIVATLQYLTPLVHRVVIDRTNLTGAFDLELRWAPDAAPAAGVASAGQPAVAPADASTPSLFTAIQEQLGLKLEPGRAPVDVIVIDSVERPAAD
jgi:bla regulator protein blaR1